MTRRGLGALLLNGLLLVLECLLAAPVLAHDCERAWRRAQDCLRTPGIAEGLGTAVGTVVVVLVNGVAIAQVLFPSRVEPGAPVGEAEAADEEEQEEPRTYTIDLRTQDARASLTTDGEDSLWVYGRVTCSDPEIDTTGLTAGLTFRAEGANAAWLVLDPPRLTGGSQAVMARARPPRDGAVPAPGGVRLTVAATIEGQRVTGTVALDLTPPYVMEFL
jgi:hypothetical protein